MKQFNRFLELTLHGIFIILFLMSIVLYKERLFADAAYYAFHAINSGSFHIEHGRIVLALSQIVPLIGYYLHLPLKFLVVLSSLGHELFYYCIFLLIFYRLKDQAGALALLLIHLIGQLWLYYSPMLEICYGAALALLFYSILRSGAYKDDKWFILLLLAEWFTLTSHLENFLLIAVAMSHDIVSRGFKKRVHISTAVFFVIALVTEFLTFSDYESQKMGSSPGVGELLKLTEGEYLSDLFQMFVGYFPEVLLFSLTSAVFLISKKYWKQLVILIGSILALILAVNKNADANQFSRYYESMYNPLVFIAVFYFLYEVFNKAGIRSKVILSTFICLVALFRIGWIWNHGLPLQERSAQMERLVDYAQWIGYDKYLIEIDNFQKEYSSVAWSNPIETLLYSAIDGKNTALSIATNYDYYYDQNPKKVADSNYIFRRFEIKDLKFLNDRFFHFEPQPYYKLNSLGFEKPPKEYAKNLGLVFNQEKLIMTSKDTSYFEVTIDNKNAEGLPSSLDEQIFLSYHLYKNGELHNWDGLRTPIEVDIYGAYTQDIKVAAPKEPGTYEIEADIVIEGVTWFEMNKRSTLQVD